MADRNNFVGMDAMLMQELTCMFPNVSSGMIMETMIRHNNKRAECIEDLSLSCDGHCNVFSVPTDRYGYAGRSQSVSGAPSDHYNNNNNNIYQFRDHPQSAPVVTSRGLPFGDVSVTNYQNSNENLPSFTTTASKFFPTPQPTRPPVPPPTYRSSIRHDFRPPPNQQYYVFPPEQRHISSLIIAPNRLPPLYTNGRPPGVYSQEAVSNPWGNSGFNQDLKPPSSGIPYHSQLQISIGPNSSCATSPRPESQTPPNDNYPHQQYFYPPSPNYLQPYLRQAPNPQPLSPRTPRKSSNDGFLQRSLVDMEDPEQRKITHMPLRPATSPLPGCLDNAANNFWTVFPPSQAPPGDEPYTKALLVHQQQKLMLLQKEVERLKIQSEDELREILMLEMEYYRKQINPQDHACFTFQEIQNLRSEVRSLMAGCSNMSYLVDQLNRGQVPLGETADEFYQAINTGQEGPVSGRINRPQVGPTRPMRASHPPPPASPHDPSQRGEAAQISLPPVAQTAVNEDDGDPKWACCACTFLNNSSLNLCEMCEMPKFVQANV